MDFLTPNPTQGPTSDQIKALHSQLLPSFQNLLRYLVEQCGWRLEQIHFFGWGEGGTIALEVARIVGTSDTGRRLGSAVSVAGDLLSTPSIGTPKLDLETPILYFFRPNTPSKPAPSSLEKTFKTVKPIAAAHDTRSAQANERGQDIRMPSNESEWGKVMKFWSQVLERAPMNMGGDVYEVVS